MSVRGAAPRFFLYTPRMPTRRIARALREEFRFLAGRAAEYIARSKNLMRDIDEICELTQMQRDLRNRRKDLRDLLGSREAELVLQTAAAEGAEAAQNGRIRQR